jgi:glycerate kinase
MLIPRHALIASEPFAAQLTAERAAEAVAAGLCAAGCPLPDLLELEPRAELAAQLLAQRFDERLRAARALVLVTRELDERTLAGSPAFELATRARQAGVPAYAVTGENRLNTFDARILDLQLIVQARERRGLRAAGRRLAALLNADSPGTRT